MMGGMRTATILIPILLLAGCSTATTLAPQTQPTTSVTTTASTCATISEAILTGTPAEIDTAMLALIADKTADINARAYAKSYVDHKDSKELRSINSGFVQAFCTGQ